MSVIIPFFIDTKKIENDMRVITWCTNAEVNTKDNALLDIDCSARGLQCNGVIHLYLYSSEKIQIDQSCMCGLRRWTKEDEINSIGKTLDGMLFNNDGSGI